MTASNVRQALTATAVLAFLAACSGTQPPIEARGAMPQSNASHLPNADRYAVIFNFGTSSGSCVDGVYPTWSLVPIKGLLYGPTYEGGAKYGGTVFSISPDGAEHVVSDFNLYDGPAGPSGLIVADGRIYGTRTAFHGGPPYGEPMTARFSVCVETERDACSTSSAMGPTEVDRPRHQQPLALSSTVRLTKGARTVTVSSLPST